MGLTLTSKFSFLSLFPLIQCPDAASSPCSACCSWYQLWSEQVHPGGSSGVGAVLKVLLGHIQNCQGNLKPSWSSEAPPHPQNPPGRALSAPLLGCPEAQDQQEPLMIAGITTMSIFCLGWD